MVIEFGCVEAYDFNVFENGDLSGFKQLQQILGVQHHGRKIQHSQTLDVQLGVGE
jgi:hypothetical protein